ncbi:MAG: M56 family metallopeptidase [Phycisphaerae bacterium]|nr:M56 family metallopeptidase [Phycisphaerae bacterium]
MTDLFLQIGLSNACFSLALAIVAVVVGKTTRRPHLANLLWLLVLVKLVTPPLVTIPVIPISGQSDTTAVAVENHSQPPPLPVDRREFNISQSPPIGIEKQPDTPLTSRIATALFKYGRGWLPPIWLLGSVVVLVWSLVRVCRFSRQLTSESQAAPRELQAAAVEIARRLGLRTIPTICTTSARLSPMVWWTGGKVRVVIPTALLDRMDERQWKWVLAHELAHVRRRDYLVRWLEWCACVGFWWNPVVWWAQRNLRVTEEICCDALVLSSLNPKPQSYAKSILAAVESLVRPAIRPPAMASEVNSGGFLERRFKMIVSVSKNSRSKSRLLQACVLLCAMIVLPLGVASARDYSAVHERLQRAVKNGEITQEQAHVMMGALKKAAGARHDGDRKREHRDPFRPNLEAIGKRLKAAVASGQMSEKDARAKWETIAREAKSNKDRPRGGDERARVDTHVKEIWGKFQHAVRAGKMSEEDAHRKMGEIKKKIYAQFENRDKRDRGPDDREKVHAHLRGIWERLQHAVREGKMSREDAERKMGEIKREALSRFDRKDKDHREKHRGEDGSAAEAIGRWVHSVGEDIRKAAEAGKITGEQAMNKWQGFKQKQLAPKLHAAVKEGKMSEQAAREFWRQIELGEARERLKHAVRAGKISKEDAERKMGEIERAIHSRLKGGDRREHDKGRREHRPDDRARAEAHIREAGEKLRAAVRAGKMSEEDARRKMGEIEREIHARFKGGERREHHRPPRRRDEESNRHQDRRSRRSR